MPGRQRLFALSTRTGAVRNPHHFYKDTARTMPWSAHGLAIMRILWRSRTRAATASVTIRVRDLTQLFNSFDPSPFWDRDLDRQAAEFIEDEFTDKRAAAHWHLHVHAHEGGASEADPQAAIKRYYERMAVSTRFKLREQMRVSEIALLAGVVVFSVCTSLRGLLQGTRHLLPPGVEEGLIILAWIALWRPIEMLAYGWLPLYRRQRLYQRLGHVRLTVRVEATRPSTQSPPSNPAPTPHPSRSTETDVQRVQRYS
jgi:hypothetical protein